MLQTVTRTTPEATSDRWAKALDRAISNALDVLVSTSGEAFVESSSTPGLLYVVSRETCTCPAGMKGQICQHRACYLAQIGELVLQDPTGITFDGSSDREEIQIDGRYFGFAAYTEDSGWTLFQGRFPHAKRRGSFCTLEEIERELTAWLPVMLPAPAIHAAMDLDAIVRAA